MKLTLVVSNTIYLKVPSYIKQNNSDTIPVQLYISTPGPGCSELTSSLVNVLLKF